MSMVTVRLDAGEYDIKGEGWMGYYQPVYMPLAGGKPIYLGMTKSKEEAIKWAEDALQCDGGCECYGRWLSESVVFDGAGKHRPVGVSVKWIKEKGQWNKPNNRG
jgi:hypothetical protein